MKTLVFSLIAMFGLTVVLTAQDQMKTETMTETTTTVVKLEQTPGAFTQETLTLEEGEYIFEISNNNVGHQIGFVLAPKSDPEAHIKTAYVSKVVENNSSERSSTTHLSKGEYIYFCPLNPTPKYTLIVK